jgi:hypothetical protein
MKALSLLPLALLGACVGHNIGAPGTVLHSSDAPPPIIARRAAADPAAGMAEPGISEATLKRVTRELSDDRFLGRAPATEGETLTGRLFGPGVPEAGLQPGNKGSWTQDVPLVEIAATNNPALRVTGGSGPLTFNYRTDQVAGSYRAQPRVAFDNSDIVFVGYGINAPERGWNDYAGVDVKGKTVIILVNDPDWQSQTAQGTFNGRAMTYYGRWTYKYEEAARQGAAAAFIVHDTEPASYGWMTVENSWTGPQLYATTVAAGLIRRPPMAGCRRRRRGGCWRVPGRIWTPSPAARSNRASAQVPLTGLRASMSRTTRSGGRRPRT